MEPDPSHDNVGLTPPRLPKSAFDTSIFLAEKSARRSHPFVTDFHSHVLRQAMDVVKLAFQRYASGQLAVAFNGGKDCTVLLDLVIRTWYERSSQANNSTVQRSLDSATVPILAVYFRSRPQFSEVEDFIQEKIRELAIPLEIYDGDLKESLAKFTRRHPSIQGIFMGTRCDDPWSQHLQSFSPTDPSWPSVMRILPLLNMSYHHIWLYLREFDVSYCKMYDIGYSSIGWKGNTFINPRLIVREVDGKVEYKPAYLLENSDEERLYRQ